MWRNFRMNFLRKSGSNSFQIPEGMPEETGGISEENSEAATAWVLATFGGTLEGSPKFQKELLH